MPSTCWTSRPAPAISLRPAPSTTSLRGTPPTAPGTSCPTTELSVRQGSAFLRLPPPQDLDEALFSDDALPPCAVHHQLPGVPGAIWTPFIDPFLDGWSDEEARRKLRLFLNYLDRTITDSFCHANLGPAATRAGRLLLEVLAEVQNTVPNFTLKYDPEVTPDDFAEAAIRCSLGLLQPALCSHPANRDTFDDYGVSSCYNTCPSAAAPTPSPGLPSPAWWTTPGVWSTLWRSCSPSACA